MQQHILTPSAATDSLFLATHFFLWSVQQMRSEEAAAAAHKCAIGSATLAKLEVVVAVERAAGARATAAGAEAEVAAMEAAAMRDVLTHAREMEEAATARTEARVAAVAAEELKLLKTRAHVAACKAAKDRAEDRAAVASAHLEALTEVCPPAIPL